VHVAVEARNRSRESNVRVTAGRLRVPIADKMRRRTVRLLPQIDAALAAYDPLSGRPKCRISDAAVAKRLRDM
jgi:hypothetical protein